MIIPVIIISVLAAFSIWCGVELFLMGSDLAELIRKYGIVVAIALGLVSSLVFILPSTFEYLEAKQVALIGIASFVVFCLGVFLFSLARKALLTPRKVKGRDKPKVNMVAFGAIDALDFASSLLAGGLMGIVLIADYGAGLIGLCAVVIFKILERSKAIARYEAAIISGTATKINMFGSIILVAAGVIASYLVMREAYAFANTAVVASLGFLVYLSGCGLCTFVKSIKK